MASHGWEIALTVLGLLLTVIVSLIAWYLHSILKSLDSMKDTIDKQDEKIDKQTERIDTLEKANLLCKQHCFQTFVEKEDWLRESGNSRIKLEEVSDTLNRIYGKFDFIEKLPELFAKMALSITQNSKG